MTALLTLGGIVYSAVLAVTVVSPNEPVMFNFVTAVSAMLTLICAMYNNKRESMNFAVIANRKPLMHPSDLLYVSGVSPVYSGELEDIRTLTPPRYYTRRVGA